MLPKPYYRIVRPFPADEYDLFPYSGVRADGYWRDPEYASDRIGLIRAYNIIEQDLVHLFEYIEPADKNCDVYSHRLYELLLRACTEFEANCKGILEANGYSKQKNWNINDYRKINDSSRLSDYKLQIAIWHGSVKILQPFKNWATSDSLPWYQDYNNVKHDRNSQFECANLHNVIHAVAGVLAVLFSQFAIDCFVAHHPVWMYHGGTYLSHDDSIFAIKPAHNWEEKERYDFDWANISNQTNRFEEYSF